MRRISSAWTSTRAFFGRHPWLVLVIGVVLGAGIGAGAADDKTDAANAANARADRFQGLYRDEQRATDEIAAKISHQSKRLDPIDYEAGTYRAPGGGRCYGALLGSADTEDIVNNGGFSKNQTIAIGSPFFETEDCGDGVKIG
jgi:hypothetical protein